VSLADIDFVCELGDGEFAVVERGWMLDSVTHTRKSVVVKSMKPGALVSPNDLKEVGWSATACTVSPQKAVLTSPCVLTLR